MSSTNNENANGGILAGMVGEHITLGSSPSLQSLLSEFRVLLSESADHNSTSKKEAQEVLSALERLPALVATYAALASATRRAEQR